MTADATPYDLLYNPRLTVPDHADVTARWQRDSALARQAANRRIDIPYGFGASETLDLFPVDGPCRGLLMFIHGGYWRALDKRDFSFVAPSLVEAGVAVAVVNYALCPAVRVADIVAQVATACAWLHRHGEAHGVPGRRLFLCGHSAGGHLAAMMLATRWPDQAPDLPDRVVHGALSISGLYDLREVAKAPSINCDVRLTAKEALAVSPSELAPITDAPLWTAVGERENEGFHIQNRLIATRWAAVHGGDIRCPGDNHFTVLDRLATAGDLLHDAAVRLIDQGLPTLD